MKYKKIHIIKLMIMKNKVFYLKLIILILIILNGVSFHIFYDKEEIVDLCYYEDDTNYVLVEKNVISNSFISYLYKDDNDNYISEIYDYYSNEKLDLKDIIIEDKINEYNKKINDLLYLKYPKFIVDELSKDNVKKSYVFRESELVIYFNEYEIIPQINEILYLKVNYNEKESILILQYYW